MMTADTTLAPCPFCGGDARQSQGGEGEAAWFGTGCGGSQGCPAHLRGLTYRTQCAADAAWNRRAQAAPRGQALVPLTDEEIERMFFSESAEEIIKFTRALERRYGITGAPNGKPT